jgi:hypothetical protein
MTTTTVHSTPIVAPAQVPETRQANNRRRLITALRAGCQVYTSWGNRWHIWSPRSGRLHQVSRWVEDAGVRWECSTTCEHYARYGAYEQFLLGTEQYHTNGVKPCAHVLIALCAHLSAERRNEKFATDGELRVAWNSAHAHRTIVA